MMTERQFAFPIGEPSRTPNAAPTTEPTTGSVDQLDRVAQLRARRAAAAATAAGASATADEESATVGAKRPKRRRRHVAQGSRIVAAGLGATAMFGIVTVLGLDNPVSGATDPASTDTTVAPVLPAPAAPPVQVVIHRIPVARPDTAPDAAIAAVAAETAASTVVPAAPVQLTANPVVQTITVAAPSQSSSSSRSSGSSGSSGSAPAPAPAPATTKGSG